jgi:hypothetical protein
MELKPDLGMEYKRRLSVLRVNGKLRIVSSTKVALANAENEKINNNGRAGTG